MPDLKLSEQARGGGSYDASEYGSDYVDPYVVLASLGFGVFLFNIIYNLLNRSTRSLDVSDINLPLQLSDRPEEFYNFLENVTAERQDKEWTESWWTDEQTRESSHRLLKAPAGSLLKESVRAGQQVADAIRRHPASCPKSLLCKLGNDVIAWNRQPAIVLRAIQLYITSLAHHYGYEDTARYVDQIEKEGGNCETPPSDDCGIVDLMDLF